MDITGKYNEYTNKRLHWIVVIRRPIHYVHQRVKVFLDEKVKNISGSDNLVTNPRFRPTHAEDPAVLLNMNQQCLCPKDC
jgi:hypothetical protein